MAEVRTSEFVKYSNPLIDDLTSMHAWMWDCGPEEPDLPSPPDAPSGKDGDPKFDLAKIQYKRKLHAYEAALLDYERKVKEWMDFQKQYGGPYEIRMWSVDALDAITNDLRAVFDKRQEKPRYYVSERTSRMLKNRILGQMRSVLSREKVELEVTSGLPKGMKPGHGHEANLRRQIAGEKEFEAALMADPQFGQEMRA
jgi:hypothetical protein